MIDQTDGVPDDAASGKGQAGSGRPDLTVVPAEFLSACGRPGAHVRVQQVPVTIPHTLCDLRGVRLTYPGHGGATVPRDGGRVIGNSRGLRLSVDSETLDVTITVTGVPCQGGARPVAMPKMLPVLSPDEAEGLPHVSWMFAGLSGGDHEVNMVITFGGHNEPVGVQVTETPATVTLTVHRKLFPPGTPFRAIKVTALFRVRLPAPLGSRQLRGFLTTD